MIGIFKKLYLVDTSKYVDNGPGIDDGYKGNATADSMMVDNTGRARCSECPFSMDQILQILVCCLPSSHQGNFVTNA